MIPANPDHYHAGGGSACWRKNGQLIAQLGCDEEGLLIAALD
jgi:hypothetical protein